MKYLKKFKDIISFLIFIIIFVSILSIFNLIIDISPQISKIICLLGISLYCFTIGYKKGNKAENKAYKVGFKTGLIIILTLYVLSMLTGSFQLNLSKMIYYLILVIVTIFGSIVGINKKH